MPNLARLAHAVRWPIAVLAVLTLALWVTNAFYAVEATLRLPFIRRALTFESSMEGVALSVVPDRKWLTTGVKFTPPNPWQHFHMWPRFDRYYFNGKMGLLLPHWVLLGISAPMAIFGIRQVAILRRIQARQCVRCTYQVDDLAVCPECGLRNQHQQPALEK
jgi:hypothetical protein